MLGEVEARGEVLANEFQHYLVNFLDAQTPFLSQTLPCVQNVTRLAKEKKAATFPRPCPLEQDICLPTPAPQPCSARALVSPCALNHVAPFLKTPFLHSFLDNLPSLHLLTAHLPQLLILLLCTHRTLGLRVPSCGARLLYCCRLPAQQFVAHHPHRRMGRGGGGGRGPGGRAVICGEGDGEGGIPPSVELVESPGQEKRWCAEKESFGQ